MTLIFRPDMKAILHEVDGRPAEILGTTIATASQALAAVVEVFDDTNLRSGAKVRCSYIEPAGVHTFDSVLLTSEPLALNHRKSRITVAGPEHAERIQRREHVRVHVELPVTILRVASDEVLRSTTVDLSAGGMALLWPDAAPPDPGEEVRVSFRSDRLEHDHDAVVVATQPNGSGAVVVRTQFRALTPAEGDRLVTAVFGVQREALKRQREAAKGR
ncbi:MAG: PilZ domain-containing protein [Acidimicrobiia bacterium]|nr:PilZ domain-containing protein [Acidimicrobiia bacterium]